MKRYLTVVGLLVVASILAGCAHGLRSGWTSLIDGEKGLENFNRIGDVNWRGRQNRGQTTFFHSVYPH